VDDFEKSISDEKTAAKTQQKKTKKSTRVTGEVSVTEETETEAVVRTVHVFASLALLSCQRLGLFNSPRSDRSNSSRIEYQGLPA
jgi:hypothetical protein